MQQWITRVDTCVRPYPFEDILDLNLQQSQEMA
uniref:Uncharacterized protein n=1 Tax=Anguilla anguilla TaxID=7936 RepID=A0A0E9R4N0_ANGAN